MTGHTVATSRSAAATAAVAATTEEHRQKRAYEIAQALLPVALRSHLKESKYWSLATPASCDADDDEDQGMTTSAPLSSLSALQRRRRQFTSCPRRRSTSTSQPSCPNKKQKQHKTKAESTDRSSRPTTDTDTAKLQRDPNISPSSAMLTRCRARKRMTDATTITDRSSRPRKTANRSNNNEANPRQSQRLKRLSVTADAATAATTGTPNANVVVADVAAPTASSNHLNERENLLIDIAKVKTGRMVHERNGRFQARIYAFGKTRTSAPSQTGKKPH